MYVKDRVVLDLVVVVVAACVRKEVAKVTRGGRGGEPIQKSLHDAMRVQNRRLHVNFDRIYTRDVQI